VLACTVPLATRLLLAGGYIYIVPAPTVFNM
jgi:hypothetical protein